MNNFLEVKNYTITDMVRGDDKLARQTIASESIASIDIVECRNHLGTEEVLYTIVCRTIDGRTHMLFSISNTIGSKFTDSNVSAFNSYEDIFVFLNRIIDYILDYLGSRTVKLEYVITQDETGRDVYQVIAKSDRKEKDFYFNVEKSSTEQYVIVDSRNPKDFH